MERKTDCATREESMDEKQIKGEAEEWAESLAALRALSDEVNAGLLALSKNDLQQFEARVAAQQKICDSLRNSRFFDRAKLRTLAADLKLAAAAARVTLPVSDTPAARLTAIQKELAHLNRVYATFVIRTQKFFQALHSMQASHRQGYSREGKAVTADHTWACEV
jgi:hypothetical protein